MTTRRARKSPAAGQGDGAEAAPTPAGAGLEPVAGSGPALAAEREIPIALTSRAIFWQPRHLGDSAALVHLPFLFWVMETARPARIVQLGLGDGVVFLSLCQAVDKLGLEAVVMGVAEPSAKAALSPAQAGQHAMLYGDFSFVVTEESARAARHMKHGGIDLLVIDGDLDDQALAILRASWEPLLSDRAMLAVVAPERRVTGREARRHLDGLVSACPSIAFPMPSGGLDLVLLGKNQPDRLLRLAELTPGMPGYLAARQVFSRLGQGIEREQAARAKTSALTKAQGVLGETQERVAALEAELAQARAEIAAAHEAENEQVALAASLQAQIFDLQTALDEARESRALAVRVEELEAGKAALEAALAEARLKAEHEIETLKQAHSAELEAVQLALREEAEKRKSHWRRLESLSAEKAALERDLAEAAAAQAKAREAQREAHDAEIEAMRALMTTRQGEAASRAEALERQLLAMQSARDAALAGQAARLAAAEAEGLAKDEALARLRDEVAALTARAEAQRAALEAAETERHETVAALRGELEESRKALAEAEAALTAAREAAQAQERAQAEALAARDAALAGQAARLEQEQGRQAELQALNERQSQELVVLTRKLVQLQEELARRHAEADALRAEAAALRDEVAALRSSTSWKVTAPMRRIKQTFT